LQLAIASVLRQTCASFYKQPLIANDVSAAANLPAEDIMAGCFVIIGFGEKIGFRLKPQR
jgi:hypothetical protein